ncbi:hypothetical protein KOV92_RS25065 [Escherichia coli]|nr:hypothetical protein [Escherichia coli]
MIHSLAECQATAHQETVFSVLHRKVRLPPESVPAASLPIFQSRQAISRATSRAPFSKPFCIRRSAIVMLFALLLLTKKPGILPGFVVLISE